MILKPSSIYLLLLFLVGCVGANKISVVSKDKYTPNGTAALASSVMTHKTTATVNLTCEVGTAQYIESATLPDKDAIGWTACPSSSFSISQALNEGDNNLKYWFKTKKGSVTLAPQTFYVKKGSSFQLISPDVTNSTYFGGEAVIELSSTRFLVTDSYNSTVANYAGAVHVYDNQGNLVKSIYGGESANDLFGGDSNYCIDSCAGTTQKLSGGRFAVIAPGYDAQNGSILDAGLVAVYDSNGNEIFRIEGSNANDLMGNSGIKELANGNLVTGSAFIDVGGLTDAGSVFLIDGTGNIINTLSGNANSDFLGAQFFVELSNGNFVIVSASDDVGGVVDAGSVKIINGVTGAEITSLSGDNASDAFGIYGVTAFSNGNFLIQSGMDDVGGVINAGSATLVNGSTGAVVATIAGDNVNDYIGNNSVSVLSNGNFVLFAQNDDVGGNSNSGSVALINSSTGAIIATIAGDSANDSFGAGGILKVSNGNFVIRSPYDDVGAVSNAGSVKLVNGSTGAVISTYNGNDTDDYMSISGSALLSNGNFVTGSHYDDVGGAADAGSMILFNGTTGAVIATFSGDDANDRLGNNPAAALNDGKFVVFAPSDTVGGQLNVGTIKIVNGTTGALISTITGAASGASIGNSPPIMLPNGNFLLSSLFDDVGGITNAGSVREVDLITGVVVKTFAGAVGNDYFGALGAVVLSIGDYVIRSPEANYNGSLYRGHVTIIPYN
jgi:hypothetical protein